MRLTKPLPTRVGARLSISSLLILVGGISIGGMLTLLYPLQLQLERDIASPNHVNSVGDNTDKPVLLLVLIMSAPSNFDLRDVMRSTWLKLSPQGAPTKHLFVVGSENIAPGLHQKINDEQLVYGDLLILPELVDSYHNLTLKFTESLAILSSSIQFRYLLKCDEDSFVRVDSVLRELEEREKRLENGDKSGIEKCYYWGFFDGKSPIMTKGKYKEVGYNICDHYLPYALGGGYVISKTCSDFIVRNQAILQAYVNEDATVGTWLSVIKSEKRHDLRFDTESMSRGCSNKYIVQHKITRAEMIKRYENLLKSGKQCTEEIRKRSSYVYNWRVPPSRCCKRYWNNMI